MHICVEGFILSETPYRESSKILNILTKEYGLIGVIANGAKRPKSPLRSTTQKFTYAYFTILYRESKASTLISADIINHFKNTRNDLKLISYLTYICDLSYQVYINTEEIKIYDILKDTLLKLEDGLSPEVLSNIIEIRYLEFLGVGFEPFICSNCGNDKAINLDIVTGEKACSACNGDNVLIDIKVLKLLDMYSKINISTITTIKIEDKYTNIINRFLKNYYTNYTGVYINCKQHLERILKELE
ncbi:MAG: DNA repair protein RecO [bacterium]